MSCMGISNLFYYIILQKSDKEVENMGEIDEKIKKLENIFNYILQNSDKDKEVENKGKIDEEIKELENKVKKALLYSMLSGKNSIDHIGMLNKAKAYSLLCNPNPKK